MSQAEANDLFSILYSSILEMVWQSGSFFTFHVLGFTQRSFVLYFSTPVITMPCMNTRWARKKTTTGRATAMTAPAWSRPGMVL